MNRVMNYNKRLYTDQLIKARNRCYFDTQLKHLRGMILVAVYNEKRTVEECMGEADKQIYSTKNKNGVSVKFLLDR